MAELVAVAVGRSGEPVYNASKPGGVPRGLVAATRVPVLGWLARTSLGEGIGLPCESALTEMAASAAH
ncbi:MAG TPA: hypothetical protein VGN26_01510 [Armatimonadota bacterium]|jgi:hypothetical protein